MARRNGIDEAVWGEITQLDSVTAGQAATTSPDVLTLTHASAGDAGIGFGVSIAFEGEDASGNAEALGRVRVAWLNATNGAESSELSIALRKDADGIEDVFKLRSGGLVLRAVEHVFDDSFFIHFTTGTTGHAEEDGGIVGFGHSLGIVIYNREQSDIYFGTGNIARWQMSGRSGYTDSGHFCPYDYNTSQRDNVFDIGIDETITASGAHARPRNVRPMNK